MVTGIVSAPEVFLASQLAAELPTPRPVHIDLSGFDALVTTCPLNISPQNVSIFAQTIHDLIPLEYVAHNEDPLMFSHRLQACIPANRIHVSQSTANKLQNPKAQSSHRQESVKLNQRNGDYPNSVFTVPEMAD